MDAELINKLEERIDELLAAYAGLKDEYSRLTEENRRLVEDRLGVRKRIDAILEKLEGVGNP